jgi:hypothetical protein
MSEEVMTRKNIEDGDLDMLSYIVGSNEGQIKMLNHMILTAMAEGREDIGGWLSRYSKRVGLEPLRNEVFP